MKTQIKQLTPKTQIDPELEKEFNDRFKYGVIKRKIIEHKYYKQVQEVYYNASIKKD